MTIHHRLNLLADLAGPILQALRLPFPQNPPESGRIVIPNISEDDSLWPIVAVPWTNITVHGLRTRETVISSLTSAAPKILSPTSRMPNSAIKSGKLRLIWHSTQR